ncbi:MAG: DUF4294 domain-containing protein [Bacteroidales bacterium]|nr:DUF4294 domain-containing protein [Bacteroidales bacterium]
MKRTGLILLMFTFLHLALNAQEDKGFLVHATVYENDTIPLIFLPQYTVFAIPVFKNKREARRWDKLVRNIKKVYPYAKMAGEKMHEYEITLVNLRTQKERKKFLNQAENELKEKYLEELKSLTFSQGKILLKLLDRETGNTSFELVKELRGKVMAFFWQSLGRIFGYNLKEPYDPSGSDRDIELIVQMIEAGSI